MCGGVMRPVVPRLRRDGVEEKDRGMPYQGTTPHDLGQEMIRIFIHFAHSIYSVSVITTKFVGISTLLLIG